MKTKAIIHKPSETILIYGLPGTVIFMISILVSVRVGADFNNDQLVRWGTLMSCCTFLWLAYLVFQDLTQSVGCLLFKKRVVVSTTPNTLVEEERVLVVSTPCDAEPTEGVIVSVTPSEQEEGVAVSPTPSRIIAAVGVDETCTPSPTSVQEEHRETRVPTPTHESERVAKSETPSATYQQYRNEYEKAQADKKAAAVGSIIDYVERTMPPFICDSEMEKLKTAIGSWCYNPDHQPEEVRVNRASGLSPYDLRHLIWNIGERLAQFGKYDLDCRATFIRSLFYSEYRDHEIRTLKNMTLCSPKDKIPLDRPRPDDYAFHYPKAKSTIGEAKQAA